MKGNARLIETLNSLLSDELTAISRHMVHSEMCASWGDGKLHRHFEKRAIEEMKHSEKRIAGDHSPEMGAIKAHNAAIRRAGDVNDFAIREILEHILKVEDRHVDDIEELQARIGHVTHPTLLSIQVGG